jgi:hypothetical protein
MTPFSSDVIRKASAGGTACTASSDLVGCTSLVAELDGLDPGDGREPDAAVRQRDVGAARSSGRPRTRRSAIAGTGVRWLAQAQRPGHLDDARQPTVCAMRTVAALSECSRACRTLTLPS